jgi:hypothetical protein
MYIVFHGVDVLIEGAVPVLIQVATLAREMPQQDTGPIIFEEAPFEARSNSGLLSSYS